MVLTGGGGGRGRGGAAGRGWVGEAAMMAARSMTKTMIEQSINRSVEVKRHCFHEKLPEKSWVF